MTDIDFVSSDQQGHANAAMDLPYLDQVPWQQFSAYSDLASFSNAWLTLQCRIIGGVERAAVVIKDADSYRPVATWPTNDISASDMSAAAELTIQEKSGLVHRFSGAVSSNGIDVSRLHVGYPFIIDDWVYGVVVVEVTTEENKKLQVILRKLQWGSSWFESYYRRVKVDENQVVKDRLVTVLNVFSSALEHTKFAACTAVVATEIASFFDCERVSIGFLKGKNIQVKEISNTASFDKRTNLNLSIGNAMDESMDQSAIIMYPESDDHVRASKLKLTRAHQLALEQGGAKSICTYPLSENGKIIGAMTLEHNERGFFNNDRVATCERIALLIGPLLELKRRESRWLAARLCDSTGSGLKKILGAGHYTLKLTTISAIVLLAFLSTAQGAYRISADASLEGWMQRSMTVPFNSYIESSHFKAGDVVQEGDVLFRLDSRDLRLELEKWSSQKSQVEKRYLNAFSARDKTKVGVYEAQMRQADTQIALIQEQLDRTHMRAPFSGLVVSGDLSQRLGSPVEKGEILLQLAPLNAYRVILDVDERDITHLKLGMQGELILYALSEKPVLFRVEKITPVSVADQGVNIFKVEARINDDVDNLRPGMQGTAKVYIEDRKWIWIWTHRLVDWFRLWLWRWWP